MTEGGGKKGEMMERGHAGSEWMYTCNAECECVCVSEGESGLSVKVKLLYTEDLCCRFKKETDQFPRLVVARRKSIFLILS